MLHNSLMVSYDHLVLYFKLDCMLLEVIALTLRCENANNYG